MSSQHGVSASVGLKNARHGGRRRIRKHGVNQKAPARTLLQGDARAHGAQPLIFRAGPVARAPLVHQASRCAGFHNRHSILAGMFDVCEESVVRFRPGFHLQRAVVEHEDRRQPRLEFAEHHAVLDEAVVAAVIPQREVSVSERSVRALEAARERGDGSAAVFRSRSAPVETSGAMLPMPSGPGSAGSLICGSVRSDQSTRGMLRAQRVSKFVPIQIERDQVTERRRLHVVQIVDQILVTVQNRRSDEIRLHDAYIDPRVVRRRIPRSRRHGSASPPAARFPGFRA